MCGILSFALGLRNALTSCEGSLNQQVAPYGVNLYPRSPPCSLGWLRATQTKVAPRTPALEGREHRGKPPPAQRVPAEPAPSLIPHTTPTTKTDDGRYTLRIRKAVSLHRLGCGQPGAITVPVFAFPCTLIARAGESLTLMYEGGKKSALGKIEARTKRTRDEAGSKPERERNRDGAKTKSRKIYLFYFSCISK